MLLMFNSLPNNKILDWIKSKAFTDDKSNVAYMMISDDLIHKSIDICLFSLNERTNILMTKTYTKSV